MAAATEIRVDAVPNLNVCQLIRWRKLTWIVRIQDLILQVTIQSWGLEGRLTGKSRAFSASDLEVLISSLPPDLIKLHRPVKQREGRHLQNADMQFFVPIPEPLTIQPRDLLLSQMGSVSGGDHIKQLCHWSFPQPQHITSEQRPSWWNQDSDFRQKQEGLPVGWESGALWDRWPGPRGGRGSEATFWLTAVLCGDGFLEVRWVCSVLVWPPNEIVWIISLLEFQRCFQMSADALVRSRLYQQIPTFLQIPFFLAFKGDRSNTKICYFFYKLVLRLVKSCWHKKAGGTKHKKYNTPLNTPVLIKYPVFFYLFLFSDLYFSS